MRFPLFSRQLSPPPILLPSNTYCNFVANSALPFDAYITFQFNNPFNLHVFHAREAICLSSIVIIASSAQFNLMYIGINHTRKLKYKLILRAEQKHNLCLSIAVVFNWRIYTIPLKLNNQPLCVFFLLFTLRVYFAPFSVNICIWWCHWLFVLCDTLLTAPSFNSRIIATSHTIQNLKRKNILLTSHYIDIINVSTVVWHA